MPFPSHWCPYLPRDDSLSRPVNAGLTVTNPHHTLGTAAKGIVCTTVSSTSSPAHTAPQAIPPASASMLKPCPGSTPMSDDDDTDPFRAMRAILGTAAACLIVYALIAAAFFYFT